MNAAEKAKEIETFLIRAVADTRNDQSAGPVAQQALELWRHKQDPYPMLHGTWRTALRLGARFEASVLMSGLTRIMEEE